MHPAVGVAEPPVARRFFLAAIVLGLTGGAIWGWLLLRQIAGAGSMTAPRLHDVNAHGHIQVSGWIGLFIMGFALQAFPRMWGTRLSMPHVAWAVLPLTLLGLACVAGGQWAAERSDLAVAAVVSGGVLQVIGGVLFVGVLAATYRAARRRPVPADGFIAMALVWFLIQAVAGPVHALRAMTAASPEALVDLVATWQGSLRTMQVHGMALFMILGVSLRIMPGMFGLRPIPAARGWTALGLLMLGVPASAVLPAAGRLSGSHALFAGLLPAWALIVTGAALIVLSWKPWQGFPRRDRSGKFIRAAWLWFAISMAMLLLFPVYQRVHGAPFSHAWAGAARHAITVGFVSLMILGVAARVVPSIRGWDPARLSSLRGAFVLVNAGCALRVVLQVLTDWNARAFDLIPLSAVLEFAGLAWWGASMARVLCARSVPAPVAAGAVGLHPSSPTVVRPGPDATVHDLVAFRPSVRPRLARFGLDTCCSADRRIRDIAAEQGIDPAVLVHALLHDDGPGRGIATDCCQGEARR